MKADSDFTHDLGFHPKSDINVTPLVDVMLVLLVIFMITAPMLAVGMKVELPKSSAATQLGTSNPVIIVVRKDHTIAVGTDLIDRQDLVKVVSGLLSDSSSRTIQLRGEKNAEYGDVIQVLGDLAKNGFTKIAIETTPAPTN